MALSPVRAVAVGTLALLALGAATSPARAAEETGWRIATVSPTYGGDGFSDVAVTGPDDAWAVGNGPCCDPEARKISHWDGSEWRAVTLPPPNLDPGFGVAEGDILSVGPRDAWASGVVVND